MSPQEKPQHAIRRSTRLPLEIPVLLSSLDDKVAYSEAGQTTMVNAHGCGVVAPRALARALRVQLEIVPAKRQTTAYVREVVPLGDDPETWLVGLEFEKPGNFWGIDYAPSDWKIEDWKIDGGQIDDGKIEDTVAPVPGPSIDAPPAAAASAPARSQRWRLTDVSAGACYLETANPFPPGTGVVMSFRIPGIQCELEGTVRVSHPATGMGVEFTGEPAHDRWARTEEFIRCLRASCEVPRVLVGRKELRSSGQPLHKAQAGLQLADPSDKLYTESEDPDPLLQLVREGESLAPEQFLSDLRDQRMGTRLVPE
jgi:hypothetical protein